VEASLGLIDGFAIDEVSAAATCGNIDRPRTAVRTRRGRHISRSATQTK
jgi:hypothetical protein